MKENIFWSVTIIIMVFATTLPVIYQVNPSISGENLTCINSNITKLGNQSINLSMMSEGYFKNLSTDDPELAQLICQYILNHTTK
jgi:hypothetical protein